MGAGGYLFFATYNELIGEEKSTIEDNYEKTFVNVDWMVKLFWGVSVRTIDRFQTVFFEMNYKYGRDPVLTNDFFQNEILDENREVEKVVGFIRHAGFQVTGFSMGFGFRFQ